MGDRRFFQRIAALREAGDRLSAVRALSDVALAECLAALSPETDDYLANVVATELSNRLVRKNAVLDTMAEGVLLVDGQGLLLFVNPAAERIFAGEEAFGVGGRAPPGEVRRIVEEILATGGPLEIEDVEMHAPDGSRRHLAVTARTVSREDEAVGAVVVVQDVTPRRRAEDELRRTRLHESERRYRSMFDESLDELFDPGARSTNPQDHIDA